MSFSSTVNTNMVRSQLSSFDARLWRLMIWILGLSVPIITMLKPRSFIADVDYVEGGGGASRYVNYGLYFIFLVFAFIAILRHFGRKKNRVNQIEALKYWFLTMLVVAMPTISSLISGGSLQGGILGIMAFYLTTYLLPTPPIEWWVREVRIMLLIIFVYGSLATAILFPQWAWNQEYAMESSMAIFSMRLYGMANHANALAPLAIFAWMLGRFPNCQLRGEFFHGFTIFFVLLLTQSKTNWFIAFVLLGIYFLMKISSLKTIKKYLAYVTIASAFSLGLIYLVKFSPYASRIEDLMYDPQVFTLTGRLPLWLLAVEMWLEHPWIGQGLDAWSSDAMLDYMTLLGWAAPHAHNQVLQILSQGGLLGLSVMLGWALFYIKALKKAPYERRISIWWLTAFFLLPGLTEVVIQFPIGIGNTVLTWIICALALHIIKIYDQGKIQ